MNQHIMPIFCKEGSYDERTHFVISRAEYDKLVEKVSDLKTEGRDYAAECARSRKELEQNHQLALAQKDFEMSHHVDNGNYIHCYPKRLLFAATINS